MKFSTVLILWAGVMGCAHLHHLDRTAPDFLTALMQVNGEVHKRTVALALQDGRQLVVRDLRLSPDSSSWHEVYTGAVGVVPTAQVERLSFTSRSRGAWDGLKTGFEVGAVLSIFIFKIPLFDLEETWDEGLERMGQMISGGIVFAPPGLLLGILRGSRISYVFEEGVAPLPEELDEDLDDSPQGGEGDP